MTEEMKATITKNGNYPVVFEGKQAYARPLEVVPGGFILQNDDYSQETFFIAYRLFGADRALIGSVGPNGVVASRGRQIGVLNELRSSDPAVIEAFEKKYGAPGSKTLEQVQKEEEERESANVRVL